MELIPINNFKLKIMLDESDMKELNICDVADCADNDTRHAIRNILELAKNQIGFNTEGSEIFVQLYTSRSGGCELFVTKGSPSDNIRDAYEKLPEKSPEKLPEKLPEKRQRKRDSLPSKSSNNTTRDLSAHTELVPDISSARRESMIFSFDTMRDICTVCRILSKQDKSLLSSAYIGEDDSYYLVLENTNMSSYRHLDSLSFLYEFGKRERTDHISTYLYEHGKSICSNNAIKILADF